MLTLLTDGKGPPVPAGYLCMVCHQDVAERFAAKKAGHFARDTDPRNLAQILTEATSPPATAGLRRSFLSPAPAHRKTEGGARSGSPLTLEEFYTPLTEKPGWASPERGRTRSRSAKKVALAGPVGGEQDGEERGEDKGGEPAGGGEGGGQEGEQGAGREQEGGAEEMEESERRPSRTLAGGVVEPLSVFDQ